MSDDTAQARAAEVIREKQMEKVAKLDAVEASATTLEHIAALRERFPRREFRMSGEEPWVTRHDDGRLEITNLDRCRSVFPVALELFVEMIEEHNALIAEVAELKS